jgi:hypothetical protein
MLVGLSILVRLEQDNKLIECFSSDSCDGVINVQNVFIRVQHTRLLGTR